MAEPCRIPVYLDPCLFVPQGATRQERARDRARIVAALLTYAEEINQRGGCAVVGVPPWMTPTPAWMEPDHD